jgi:predicted amidohydrolase
MVRIIQIELLNQAEAEEKKYNLKEAIKLYKEVLKSLIDKDDLKKIAYIYEKIGNAYLVAVHTAETEKELAEMMEDSIEAYDKAIRLYKELNSKVKVLECRAGQFKLKADKGISPEYCREMYINSFEKYIEASEIYSGEDDKENLLRVLNQAIQVLAYLLQYLNEPSDFKKFCQKTEEIIEQGWKLSDEIGNKEYIGDFLFVTMFIFGIKGWIYYSRTDDSVDVLPKNFIERCKEALQVAEEGDYDFNKSKIYVANGVLNCILASRYIHKEEESKVIADNGIKYYEKGLTILKILSIKPMIIHYIYWLDYHAALLGKYQYLQKRILGDIQDIQKSGKIYQNSYSLWGFLTNFLSAYYYHDFAQRSFLNLNSRLSYAQKGIKEIEDGLKRLPFGPFYALSYQLLTNLYSQLVLLTNERERREYYIKKMFDNAKAAENAGKKYKGGMSRAAGYISLYRAHRTLSYIVTNKKEKIKNLSIAIDATKKNIKFSIESYRNFIAAKMHLGLLYEDLAILTKQLEPLFQARELFLNLIKDTEEKGYSYFTAIAHEYLARIEDRLGNHLASAHQYDLASKTHTRSLEKVKFKPLRERIKEKIEYAKAWKLIEEAKSNHKKEDHITAMQKYNIACKILELLSKYEYEALYYKSWALLEASEDSSKKEKHQEAIDEYQITKNSFKKSINKLKESLKTISNKVERERISKLEKVAEVRINYCSARINLEKARILQKHNEHISAAENFALAASQFRDICTLFKIERERKELEAIYYICRAWEGMELAENFHEPERFLEASKLFLKASDLFTDSKLKLLASGNSSVCLALENGCKFDESTDIQKKAEYYKKIKGMLRKASSFYEKGSFSSGADWALGTSTYFDALWHLINADEKLELDNKKKQLEIGIKYLKSAADIFEKSGYKERQEEIYEKLNRIEKEEMILYSALNTISNPVISRSTTGISAPACPIEISESPRISEIQQFSQEVSKILVKDRMVKKYAIEYIDLLKEHPETQKNTCKVGIAQIAISETGDIINEFFEMKPSGLLGIKEGKINQIQTNLKKIIEEANNLGISILIFPEMTIDLNYKTLLEDLITLAKLNEMYIIPGSYHDQNTKRNVSLVIGQQGVLWEQEKHIPATINFAGESFKEKITVNNPPKKIVVCNTEYGRIAIAICRDFLDMDLRVELKNFEPPIDIVINPAFTPVTADFKAAHFDARRSIYAYCFFANVAEFGDSLIYTPEKERVERNIPPREEGLIYKDIDLFKLRFERKKWEKEQEKELKFIQSTRQ